MELNKKQLNLDEENNYHLRMGLLFNLMGVALRDHPDVVITWQDGLLRIGNGGYYAVGCHGYILSEDDIRMAIGEISRQGVHKEFTQIT